MVENHVRTVCYSGSILTGVTFASHAETHVADNYVARARERDTVSINGNSLARRRLACNIEIVLEHDTAADFYHSGNVEHDYSIRLAHSVAERTGAAVVKIGHVIDRAVASAGGKTSPSLRSGERQLLCVDAQRASCKQQAQHHFCLSFHYINSLHVNSSIYKYTYFRLYILYIQTFIDDLHQIFMERKSHLAMYRTLPQPISTHR